MQICLLETKMYMDQNLSSHTVSEKSPWKPDVMATNHVVFNSLQLRETLQININIYKMKVHLNQIRSDIQIRSRGAERQI